MIKWADYVIVALRFREERRHVEKVKFMEDKGNELGSEQTASRGWVVSEIEKGTTFVTAYKQGTKWSKGDEVGIVEIRGQKFIRTDGNSIEEDNLGELPEF